MKSDMQRNRVDINILTISDLGVYARPNEALKLLTLHHAKGREYDAVALIDVHEGRLPSSHAKTEDDIAEQKRLFYVGSTRAKRFLLCITDDIGHNGASRFLEEICKPMNC
jgi:DNA helicase-2/ATP-dependent DNA helicase PcrA